jgi:hypothetical protein
MMLDGMESTSVCMKHELSSKPVCNKLYLDFCNSCDSDKFFSELLALLCDLQERRNVDQLS